eukprot:TRINITY_DN7357_c0_g2_i1.p1 TRINITY_DN7357_c0_g2~~TRINITY_DN7357_c0_g2_i1.p1  ORF type:complete len:839 (-),score=208.07 TRINITY_DN7357_c0_g2_i1:31-2547(-)
MMAENELKEKLKEENKAKHRAAQRARLKEMRTQQQRLKLEKEWEQQALAHERQEGFRQSTAEASAEWAEKHTRLVELEWEECQRQVAQHLDEWPLSRLVSAGLTIVDVQAEQIGYFYGEPMVKFFRRGGEQLPYHEFQKGDEVLYRRMPKKKSRLLRPLDDDEGADDQLSIFPKQPPFSLGWQAEADNSDDGDTNGDDKESDAEDLPWAQVVSVSPTDVTCVVRSLPPRGGLWRLDRGSNRVVHERTLTGISGFEGEDFQADGVRRVLLGIDVEEHNITDGLGTSLSKEEEQRLNASQRKALRCLEWRRVSLIQGPPGCGKTHTACALLAAAKHRRPLLATADSNVAVDQLLGGLLALGMNAVRLGTPASLTDEKLRTASVHSRMEQHPRYAEWLSLRETLNEHSEAILGLKKDVDAVRRRLAGLGFKDEDEEAAAAEEQEEEEERMLLRRELEARHEEEDDAEGVDVAKELRQQLLRAAMPEIKRKIYQLEVEMTADIVQEADVVCSTLVGCGSNLLSKANFDVVLIDEATQATESRAVIAINRLSRDGRLVLVGDQKQLPPVCVSRQAQTAGLGVSLFDRLLEHPQLAPTMLTVQFRMHPLISSWPSQAFYEDKLEDGVKASERPLVPGFAWPQAGGVAFVAAQGQEKRSVDGNSWVNDGESDVVCTIVRRLVRQTSPRDIGVISPYSGQVARLKRQLLSSVEVHTVDGYQGREKPIIIVSCVRSNLRGSVGFLSDYRRLNVALTRAQRGLIVIGNPETLRHDKYWKSWLGFVKSRKLQVSLVDKDFVAADGGARTTSRGRKAAAGSGASSKGAQQRARTLRSGVSSRARTGWRQR